MSQKTKKTKIEKKLITDTELFPEHHINTSL